MFTTKQNIYQTLFSWVPTNQTLQSICKVYNQTVGNMRTCNGDTLVWFDGIALVGICCAYVNVICAWIIFIHHQLRRKTTKHPTNMLFSPVTYRPVRSGNTVHFNPTCYAHCFIPQSFKKRHSKITGSCGKEEETKQTTQENRKHENQNQENSLTWQYLPLCFRKSDHFKVLFWANVRKTLDSWNSWTNLNEQHPREELHY